MSALVRAPPRLTPSELAIDSTEVFEIPKFLDRMVHGVELDAVQADLGQQEQEADQADDGAELSVGGGAVP
jgi:hypothetical protein